MVGFLNWSWKLLCFILNREKLIQSPGVDRIILSERPLKTYHSIQNSTTTPQHLKGLLENEVDEKERKPISSDSLLRRKTETLRVVEAASDCKRVIFFRIYKQQVWVSFQIHFVANLIRIFHFEARNQLLMIIFYSSMHLNEKEFFIYKNFGFLTLIFFLTPLILFVSIIVKIFYSAFGGGLKRYAEIGWF